MSAKENHTNLALGALAAAIGMASGTAGAATFTVTSNSPVGPNSLGLAMSLANANAEPDTINIETTGLIDLAGTSLAYVNEDGVTINGPGMDQLTIVGTTGEGAVFRSYDGALSLSAMTITGAVYGAIRARGADVTLSQVSISGNTHESDLVRAYNEGSLDISDSVFSDNLSTESDNVIDAYGLDYVEISGTTISGNSSDNQIVELENIGEGADIENSWITDNSVTESSGTIYVYQSDLDISDSEISGNTSAGDGGAISARYGSLDVTDSLFDGNSASEDGGAISMRYTEANISGSVFSGNTAYSGGAINSESYSGSLSIESSSFVGNSVSSDEGSGGAVHVDFDGRQGGSVSITGSLFKKNESSGSDGAIRVRANSTDIQDTVISGNTAIYGAGGIRISTNYYASGSLDRTVVDDNTSVYGTGGVSLDVGYYAGFTIADSTVSNNTTTRSEGSASGLSADLEHNRGGSSLTIRNSTISGNSGDYEAVEIDDFSDGYYRNSLDVLNSTFSGNRSITERVPIFFDGVADLNIEHSTFVDNRGSGVETAQVHIEPKFSYYEQTEASLTNVVFSSSNDYEVITNGSSLDTAGGFSGVSYAMDVSIQGTVMTNGLLDYGEGDTSFSGDSPLEVDPELGSLKNNGGATKTHAPTSADSYVVDAGEGQSRPDGEDQRGVAPAAGDTSADLGAVEYLDPAVNTAPELAVNIGRQLSGTVGTEISGFAVADAFTDAEGDNISVESVTGLPGGLSFNEGSISGELLVPGDFFVTVIVSDDGTPSLATSATFDVRVSDGSGLSAAEIAVLLDDDDDDPLGGTPLVFFSTMAALAWLRRRRR